MLIWQGTNLFSLQNFMLLHLFNAPACPPVQGGDNKNYKPVKIKVLLYNQHLFGGKQLKKLWLTLDMRAELNLRLTKCVNSKTVHILNYQTFSFIVLN